MSERIVRIGLLGCGTVGQEIVRILHDRSQVVAQRTGLRLELARIAVARLDKPRAPFVPAQILTGDATAVATDPAVDVVVEVMGGIEPARTCLEQAMALGKPVVTANKQLLALYGPELLSRAAEAGVRLGFEGAVGASIPLIKPLRESFAADQILSIKAILNGTTNYILTRMTAEGVTFSQALAAAQERGFAEADPADDVEGYDAAAKLAILVMTVFNARVTIRDVHREGIGSVTPREIDYAKQLGYVIKLLAVAEERDGVIDCRVHPALLPFAHPLASIPDERNAVLVTGAAAGPIVFSGPGAGGAPTAVIVLGDVLDVAGHPAAGARAAQMLHLQSRQFLPVGHLLVPYFFSLQVLDRPGVFARVATVFGEEQVSIASIVQKSRGETADVVLMTHEALDAAVQRVVTRLRAMDVVSEVSCVLRVEEG